MYTLGGPIWVQTWGSALIFVHMISSVQINSFPIHDMIEQLIYKWGHIVNWWQRVCLRVAYGAITTFFACLIPFFGNLMVRSHSFLCIGVGIVTHPIWCVRPPSCMSPICVLRYESSQQCH